MTKYPRTKRLYADGDVGDDLVMEDLSRIQAGEIVVTAKMDGECTTMYPDAIHARSLEEYIGADRSFAKSLHATVAHRIPEGTRICGENLQARHTILYKNLRSYFYMFSAWEGDVCLSWGETEALAEELGLEMVPVLYRGPWNDWEISRLMTVENVEGDPLEGIVVRASGKIVMKDFGELVGKIVKPAFSQAVNDSDHWRKGPLVMNGLR